jgi:hypothetical protein
MATKRRNLSMPNLGKAEMSDERRLMLTIGMDYMVEIAVSSMKED